MSRASLPPTLLALALLVVVYALALGSLKPLDLALGLVLAATTLTLYRGFLRSAERGPDVPGLARRVLALAPFLAIIVREVLSGTWRVSQAVVGLRPPRSPGIVAVPMEDRSELGVAVSGLAISLTPGELVVDLDWNRREMLVHALDADDPEALRATQRRLYERYQRKVFP